MLIHTVIFNDGVACVRAETLVSEKVPKEAVELGFMVTLSFGGLDSNG